MATCRKPSSRSGLLSSLLLCVPRASCNVGKSATKIGNKCAFTHNGKYQDFPAMSGFGPWAGSYRGLQNHNTYAFGPLESCSPSIGDCGGVRYTIAVPAVVESRVHT
ncbi:hypothetical protein TNCV_3341601 [Trichonephila clavipes]|nr:hypothetical protein TNCV_3341601 [Trichonephila clavipes]